MCREKSFLSQPCVGAGGNGALASFSFLEVSSKCSSSSLRVIGLDSPGESLNSGCGVGDGGGVFAFSLLRASSWRVVLWMDLCDPFGGRDGGSRGSGPGRLWCAEAAASDSGAVVAP